MVHLSPSTAILRPDDEVPRSWITRRATHGISRIEPPHVKGSMLMLVLWYAFCQSSLIKDMSHKIHYVQSNRY